MYDMLIALALAFVFGALMAQIYTVRIVVPVVIVGSPVLWVAGWPLLTLALLFVCLEFGYVAGCVGRARWDAWRRRGSP
jgi:hypothetical protein